MMFLWVLIGVAALLALVAVVNWWRDEQIKMGNWIPPMSSVVGEIHPVGWTGATPRHPSIDPYLAELRVYLLTPPLPQGPGEMAERVYAHLTLWLNTHLTQDAPYDTDLAGDLLIEPTHRFVDMSRNEAAPPPGYLEELMREDQP